MPFTNTEPTAARVADLHSISVVRAKQLLKRALSILGLDIRLGDHRVFNLRDLLEHVRKNGLSARCILDVGAYCGEWSETARKVFPGAQFILIEPVEELAPFLRKVCSKAPGSRWFTVAAGPVNGETVLTMGATASTSSCLAPNLRDARADVHERRVPMVTIDSLIRENQLPAPQVAKFDIQGFELEALKGGVSLFDSVELFILEASLFRFLPGQSLVEDVIPFMKARGYSIYDIIGLSRRPYDGALGQVDLCFAKRDGVLRSTERWK